jgi:hypothetical protein
VGFTHHAVPVAPPVVPAPEGLDGVAAWSDRALLQLGVHLADLLLQILGQVNEVGVVGGFVGDEPGIDSKLPQFSLDLRPAHIGRVDLCIARVSFIFDH